MWGICWTKSIRYRSIVKEPSASSEQMMWVDEAVPFHAFSLGHRMPHQTSKDASTGDDPCRRCVGRQSCGCNAGPEGCHRAVPPLAEEEALKRKGLIKEHGHPAQLDVAFLEGWQSGDDFLALIVMPLEGCMGAPRAGPHRVRCCLWSISRQHLPGVQQGRAGSSCQFRRHAASNSCARHPQRRFPRVR